MTSHISWLILLLFIIAQGVALGAGLYEQRIVVPQWTGKAASGEPYLNADAMRTADTGRRFWGFVTTGPLTLLTLASLVAAWQSQGALQVWWLGSALITLVERIATFGYFIPVAIRLMKAEEPVPASVRAQALQWGKPFSGASSIESGLQCRAWLGFLDCWRCRRPGDVQPLHREISPRSFAGYIKVRQHVKYFAAILSLTISVAGCALGTSTNRMTYPDRWPPLVGAAGCGSLPGRYALIGENAQPSSNSVNSPTLFALFGSPVAHKHTHVQLELNQEQKNLVLRAYGGDIARREISLPVTCINGSLVHLDQTNGGSDGASSVWRGKVTLTKATDGSLVAHAQGTVRSSDLLFKWGHDYDSLYRFAAIESR